MATNTRRDPADETEGTGSLSPDFTALSTSFVRALRAANRTAKTIETYECAMARLSEYLTAQGMPSAPAHIRREHLEAFFADLLARHSPATARTYHAALRSWFHFLEEEGEVRPTPMAHIKAPAVPENPPAVLTDAQIAKLLKVCEGKDFASRRDSAIIRLLLDTGMRRSEIAGLTMEDVDLTENVARVVGKGRRVRLCPFGRKAALALDRYLRVRGQHRHKDAPQFWLGLGGPFGDEGLYEMVKRRAAAAGLEGVFTHLFRHSWAHQWLLAGGQEADLRTLGGWRSPAVMARYGASAAGERARAAHRRLGLGDRY